ncbi:MAG TPA: GldG family protein [Candidatus Methylacidiphilales bacterium]
MSSPNRLPSAKSLRLQLGWNSVLTIVLALAVCIGANYLGYRFYKRHDYSKGATNTLSGKTLQVLSGLQEPVTITTSLLTSEMGGQIEALLREYKYRGNGKVKLEFVNPAVNLSRAEELKAKYSLDPAQENVVVFEYKDRHKVVSESELADYAPGNPYTGQPGQMTAFKGEAVFTAAILSLVEGKSAKVYFLLGHGERDLADVSNLGGIGGLDVYLKRDNLVTAPLNLADKGSVPDDADALVIPGPRVSLSPAEVQAVTAYLDAKGKVILLQDPKIVSGLEPVAQRYGMVIQDDRVQAVMKMGGASLLVRTAVANDYAAHPAVNAIKGLNLKMDNARSIALAPAKDASTATASKVTALVRTSAAYWGETSPDDSKPQFDEGVDIKGPLTLAMVYDGGDVPGDGVKLAGTRFAIIGSSAFLTNEKLDGTGLDFFQGLLDWMLKKDLAIGIAPKAAQDFGLNVSPLQKSTIISLALFLAPGLAVLGGLGVWFARRR